MAGESALHHAQMVEDRLTDDKDPSAPGGEEGNGGNTENTRGSKVLSSPNPGDLFVDSWTLTVGFLGEEGTIHSDKGADDVGVDGHDEVTADGDTAEMLNFEEISCNMTMAYIRLRGAGSTAVVGVVDWKDPNFAYPNLDPSPVIDVQHGEGIHLRKVQEGEDPRHQDSTYLRL